MHLLSAITSYLPDSLLTQLAQASALPVGEARRHSNAATVVLVQELRQPTNLDEQNARWDMCRQLYLSEVLTNTPELLRTDLGWPSRRYYLAEKILGTNQLAALGATASESAPARLLGYLTVLALAVAGEEASRRHLNPAGLGEWLQSQPLPAAAEPAATPKPAGSAKPAAAPKAAAGPAATRSPRLASAGRSRVKLVSILSAVLAGLGVAGYVASGSQVQASVGHPEAATEVVTPADVAVREPVAATAAPMVAVSHRTPSPLVAPAAAPAAPADAKAAGPVLRDTVGNAEIARNVGGRFDAAAGHYLKGENQPLLIKLVDGATLTVGINSTESLLYKYLSNSAMRPQGDLVIDRLTFATSEARLGAEGAQQLGSLASLLKTFPKSRLLLIGHANLAEGNMTQLALQRAQVAVDELHKRGIGLDRLQAQGQLATGTPTDHDSPERQAMLQGISLKISKM